MIDRGALKVTLAGREVHLTPTELRLLLELVRHPGQVLNRATCCGPSGTTPTWPTPGWWTPASSGSAPRSRPCPPSRVHPHGARASATGSARREAGCPTGLRGRLVITFTLVAVTASSLVAGIGYELVKRR